MEGILVLGGEASAAQRLLHYSCEVIVSQRPRPGGALDSAAYQAEEAEALGMHLEERQGLFQAITSNLTVGRQVQRNECGAKRKTLLRSLTALSPRQFADKGARAQSSLVRYLTKGCTRPYSLLLASMELSFRKQRVWGGRLCRAWARAVMPRMLYDRASVFRWHLGRHYLGLPAGAKRIWGQRYRPGDVRY